MKILILTDCMQTGGAETHIYELSRSLLSLSHEVVVLSHGGDMAAKLQSEGIRHIRVPRMGSIRSIYCILQSIRNEKPNILHAHTRKTALICRLLAPFLSVPCVFTAHAKFKAGGLGRLTGLFRGKTIAVSRDIANHMEDRFAFPKETITVIGNGIDTEFFKPTTGNESRNFHILTVSRLDRDCALAATLLLRILPILRQSHRVTLTVVGGGDALPELQSMAKGMQGVILAGALTDVRPHIADCDLFVGVSRAALEAMAMEKPVLLCGNEGYLGILKDGNMAIAEQSNFCARGLPIPDADTLSSDILSFLALPDQKRAALGERGRAQVLSHHTAMQMAKDTLSVYRAALREYQDCDILLCGYYGFGNMGDELVLRALVRGLREMDPTLRIAALVGKGAPDGVRGIPRYRLQAIRRSGAVFLGGGTLLQSASSRRSLYYYLSLLALARRHGKPYGMLLGGVGPIENETDRTRVARVLKDAAFLGLRDAASLSLLAEMGLPQSNIHVGADPVLCLPLPAIARIPQFLTVFPRRFDPSLIEAIEAISSQYALPVRIGIMDENEDKADAELLARALQAETVDIQNEETLCRLICRSRLVLTSRLHASIVAYHFGVPAISLSSDKKLSAFLQEAFSPEAARRLSLPARPTKEALLAAGRFALLSAERIKTERNDRYALLCRRARRQIALFVEKVIDK